MTEESEISPSSSSSSVSSLGDSTTGSGSFRTSSRHKKEFRSMAATVPELIKILGGNKVIEKVSHISGF